MASSNNEPADLYDDSDDSDTYVRTWNELMKSPYQSVFLDASAIPSSNGDDPLALDAIWHPHPEPFIPLSPPSSPPTRALPVPVASPRTLSTANVPVQLPLLSPIQQVITLPIVHSNLPAENEASMLDAIQPVTPPYSASPPTSPKSLILQISPQAATLIVQPGFPYAPGVAMFPTTHTTLQPLNQLLITVAPIVRAAVSAVPAILAQHSPLDDFTDGGRPSNMMALSVLGVFLSSQPIELI